MGWTKVSFLTFHSEEDLFLNCFLFCFLSQQKHLNLSHTKYKGLVYKGRMNNWAEQVKDVQDGFISTDDDSHSFTTLCLAEYLPGFFRSYKPLSLIC